jgi:hypothetical protein
MKRANEDCSDGLKICHHCNANLNETNELQLNWDFLFRVDKLLGKSQKYKDWYLPENVIFSIFFLNEIGRKSHSVIDNSYIDNQPKNFDGDRNNSNSFHDSQFDISFPFELRNIIIHFLIETTVNIAISNPPTYFSDLIINESLASGIKIYDKRNNK